MERNNPAISRSPAAAPPVVRRSRSEALFQRALGLYRSGDCTVAEEVLGALLAAAPGHVEARRLAVSIACAYAADGQAFHKSGRPDAAVSCYQRALSLEPDSADTMNNLGAALQAIGRLDDAALYYRKALELQPKLVAALINLHSLCYGAESEQAADYLEQALACDPDEAAARLLLGALRDDQGRTEAAARHFAALPSTIGAEVGLASWRFIRSITEREPTRPRLFGTTVEGLGLGLEAACIDGLVLEFGVRFGTSLRWIAGQVDGPVHGFDSFTGLPEAWVALPRGSYSTGGVLPDMPPGVQLHPGLFEDSLPIFLAAQDGPVRFMNVDCDLYSSTVTVLDRLSERIVAGTVIVFDEFLNHPGWLDDEYRAFTEAVARYSWRFEYLGFSLFSKQAVVRIL
ncbi:MAG: tetratricopeptide repeat protein [Rhodospirillaceae bacterium]